MEFTTQLGIRAQITVIIRAKTLLLREVKAYEKIDEKIETESIRIFSGLCYLITKSLIDCAYLSYSDIGAFPEIYIPLFKRFYAKQYANAIDDAGYWWARDNYKDRITFLDWMLSELQKQLKN